MRDIPITCPKCGKTITVKVVEDTPVCVGGKSYEITCSCGESAGTVISDQILRVDGGSYSLEMPY